MYCTCRLETFSFVNSCVLSVYLAFSELCINCPFLLINSKKFFHDGLFNTGHSSSNGVSSTGLGIEINVFMSATSFTHFTPEHAQLVEHLLSPTMQYKHDG